MTHATAVSERNNRHRGQHQPIPVQTDCGQISDYVDTLGLKRDHKEEITIFTNDTQRYSSPRI